MGKGSYALDSSATIKRESNFQQTDLQSLNKLLFFFIKNIEHEMKPSHLTEIKSGPQKQ